MNGSNVVDFEDDGNKVTAVKLDIGVCFPSLFLFIAIR